MDIGQYETNASIGSALAKYSRNSLCVSLFLKKIEINPWFLLPAVLVYFKKTAHTLKGASGRGGL